MACIRKASASVIMKKQKTYKEVSQSGMAVMSEYMKFQCGPDYKQISYADIKAMENDEYSSQYRDVADFGMRLFMKRAKVGQSKHIRVRPRFDQWRVSGSLLVTAPELTKEVLKTIIGIAGTLGMCDWRPGCKTPGSFGMYKAELRFNG